MFFGQEKNPCARNDSFLMTDLFCKEVVGIGSPTPTFEMMNVGCWVPNTNKLCELCWVLLDPVG